MFSHLANTIQRHFFVFSGFILLLIGTTVFFIFNEEKPVDAGQGVIQVSETVEKEVEADTVVFELSFTKTDRDEQQLYNAVLSQTNQVLDVLKNSDVLPVEYTISREQTEPNADSKDFSMTQRILIESSTISSAKNVYPKIEKFKGVKLSKLQYGFADIRPYQHQLKDEAFQKLQSDVIQTTTARDKEVVELVSVDGYFDATAFNPEPLYLNDPVKKVPFFPHNSLSEDGIPSFDAQLTLSETVRAEYRVKEKNSR